ncbi:MAG: cyclic pyranopterin monophosphate synthase MoaC [Dehalococcoidia bacterium]|nr:cyclic pyranopterin monophosphate synthase MoaC [Dehalococcoidia bacterium]MDD5647504.1 cyclic pyranopterin monophosphate synthase MoaC [Dehalococcoidia bacterium]
MAKHDTRMIDVSNKKDTQRLATATACISMSRETLRMVKRNEIPKGDVLAVAQAAGIMAAKKTADLIPLCHPLMITSISVDFSYPAKKGAIAIEATVRGQAKTGFEMEALTAAAVTALTIYDMCKMFDQAMAITDIFLVKKTGGKSGTYIANRSTRSSRH